MQKILIDPYQFEKIKKFIKHEFCGKIMTEFVALRAKTYSYLDYDGEEEKKPKEQKNVLLKKRLNLTIIKCVCLIIILS